MDGFRKLVTERLRAQSDAALPRNGDHPSADLLSAYAERSLPEIEREAVLQHLGICRDCRDTVYLALPSAAEMQPVVALSGAPSRRFALRWGTLAAAIAVGAIALLSTRHPNQLAKNSSAESAQAKSQALTSAELKPPPEMAEMRAVHNDLRTNDLHTNDRDTNGRDTSDQKPNDKIIPTPKHMTAKPAAAFDIDQTGQVRVQPPASAAMQKSSEAGPDAAAKVSASAAPAPSDSLGDSKRAFASGRTVTAMATTASNQIQGVMPAHGAVGGSIVDASGAVIRGAIVTIGGLVETRAMQSNSQGQFKFDQLTPGPYSIHAQAPGFQTTAQQIAVLNQSPLNLHLTLQVGAMSESVEVSGAQTEVEASRPAVEPSVEEKPAAAENGLAAQGGRSIGQASIGQTAIGQSSIGQTSIKPTTSAASKKASPAPAAALTQWTLASDGTVQRSLDSGNTWNGIRVSGSSVFRSLSATGTDVWVGGNAGALYHSADSGQTWMRVSPSASGRSLKSDIIRLEFPDSANGTILCANGESWATADGGQSWTIK